MLRFGTLVSLVFATSSMATAATVTVNAIGVTFVPQHITIAEGDTVQWLTDGLFDHTVTENAGAFNHSLLQASPGISVTFDTAFLNANPRPGHKYDYHCIPHFFLGMNGSVTVAPASAWSDIGLGLAGTNGVPGLAGTGTLASGTSGTIELTNGLAGAFSILFITVGTNTPQPFFGGTIATTPVHGQVPITLPVANLTHNFTMPAGVPSGVQLTVQWGIQDPNAVQGVSLSNAIQATTP